VSELSLQNQLIAQGFCADVVLWFIRLASQLVHLGGLHLWVFLLRRPELPHEIHYPFNVLIKLELHTGIATVQKPDIELATVAREV